MRSIATGTHTRPPRTRWAAARKMRWQKRREDRSPFYPLMTWRWCNMESFSTQNIQGVWQSTINYTPFIYLGGCLVNHWFIRVSNWARWWRPLNAIICHPSVYLWPRSFTLKGKSGTEERVNIFNENLMKISWKIRKLWHFQVSQNFKKHVAPGGGGGRGSMPLAAVPHPRESPSEKHPKRGFKGRPKDTLNGWHGPIIIVTSYQCGLLWCLHDQLY